jgi:hypothetical protein
VLLEYPTWPNPKTQIDQWMKAANKCNAVGAYPPVPADIGTPFLHDEGRTIGTALGQLRRDTDASEDDTAGQPLRLTDSLQCLSIFVFNFFRWGWHDLSLLDSF